LRDTPTPYPDPEFKEVGSAVVQIIARRRLYNPSSGVTTSYKYPESGFLISADGFIVTTFRNVGGATEIEVMVPGRGRRSATIVAASQCSDLALFRIEGANYPFLEMDPSSASAGETVCLAGIVRISEQFALVRGVSRGTTIWVINGSAPPPYVTSLI